MEGPSNDSCILEMIDTSTGVSNTEKISIPDEHSQGYELVRQHRAPTDVSEGVEVRNRSPTFSPEFPENAPTVLTFENLVVKTKDANPIELLKSVSGSITGFNIFTYHTYKWQYVYTFNIAHNTVAFILGGLWAIMGASGGGKTTLLSALSLRLDSKRMDIAGSIRLNGREYDKSVLKSMSAYVMQVGKIQLKKNKENRFHDRFFNVQIVSG